jgi:hypothetical protein
MCYSSPSNFVETLAHHSSTEFIMYMSFGRHLNDDTLLNNVEKSAGCKEA